MDRLTAVLDAGLSFDEIQRMQRAGATESEIIEAAYALLQRGESLTDEEPEQEPVTLSLANAVDLMQMDLPPVRFVVDGLIPQGLTILAAPPKFGKSWMVLDLGLAVAAGANFLGFKANKGRVLYLALEDSLQRLKARLSLLLGGREAPEGFDFATSCHPLSEGLIDELGSYVSTHSDTALIIVDTLQRVRGSPSRNESPYAADYREAGLFKSFADKHGIALVLVHHLRKAGDDSDPFSRISGTNGLFGAADSALVLTREKRGDERTTLHLTGRDVEAQSLELHFDKATGRWVNNGDTELLAAERERREYECSPIVKTIRKLLSQSPTGWEGTASDLTKAGTFITRRSIANNARDLASKLRALDPLLLEHDGIIHERRGNGTGGGKHIFQYLENDCPFEE